MEIKGTNPDTPELCAPKLQGTHLIKYRLKSIAFSSLQSSQFTDLSAGYLGHAGSSIPSRAKYVLQIASTVDFLQQLKRYNYISWICSFLLPVC